MENSTKALLIAASILIIIIIIIIMLVALGIKMFNSSKNIEEQSQKVEYSISTAIKDAVGKITQEVRVIKKKYVKKVFLFFMFLDIIYIN